MLKLTIKLEDALPQLSTEDAKKIKSLTEEINPENLVIECYLNQYGNTSNIEVRCFEITNDDYDVRLLKTILIPLEVLKSLALKTIKGLEYIRDSSEQPDYLSDILASHLKVEQDERGG